MRHLAIATTLVVTVALGGCATGTSATKSTTPPQQGALRSLALMRQGSVLLQQQRYREALKQFEEAHALAPQNPTADNMIGLCHFRLGELDKALAAFSEALDIIPSFTDARNNRGAVYLALGQYRMAELDFLSVLSDATYPHRWEVYYNLGVTYLQRNELAAAEENFRKAIAAPSPIYGGFLGLAEVEEKQGRPEAAVKVLEDARLQFPEQMDAAFTLGRLYLLLGRTEEGRAQLEEIVASRPESELAREAETLLGGE